MSGAPIDHETRIELVVFDLGRVLVRICDNWAHACTSAGVPGPVEVDPANLIQLHELSLRQEVGAISSMEFSEAAASLMRLPVEQVRSASEAYIQGAYPGAAELVEELTAAGIATACLSNTNDHHWQIMCDSAHPASFPMQRLTHRFASHLVKARKPDEQIYAHLERVTGVSPGAILFFDDIEANVDAARRRGWNVRRIDPAANDPVGQMRESLRTYHVLP